MGGERASSVRQRLAGKICCLCGVGLPAPHRPGERRCERCAEGQALLRRVYMSFMERTGWFCQFLEADLQTELPRSFTFRYVEKIRELAKRGAGLPDLEAASALEHGIEIGRGGVWLSLTPEQYARLKERG